MRKIQKENSFFFRNAVFPGSLTLLSEEVSVVFDKFTYQQEGVDGGDAVAYDAGCPFPLGAGLLGYEQAFPQRGELVAVVLDFRGKFLLAQSDVVKRVVFLFGGSDGQHRH